MSGLASEAGAPPAPGTPSSAAAAACCRQLDLNPRTLLPAAVQGACLGGVQLVGRCLQLGGARAVAALEGQEARRLPAGPPASWSGGLPAGQALVLQPSRQAAPNP